MKKVIRPLPHDAWGNPIIPGPPKSLVEVCISEGEDDAAAALQFIKAGAKLNALSDGNTPLMYATSMQKHKIMETLIAAGANVNVKAPNEPGDPNTALMMAAEKGDLWAVKRLLQAGADVQPVTGRKETALYWAAATSGNVQIVKLLSSAGCVIHHNELHWPVFKRNVDMVKLLLELGCDPNGIFSHQDDEIERGDTPLLIAVRKTGAEFLGFKPDTKPQRRVITKLLLKKGANPNIANGMGMTPLMEAFCQRNLSYAKLLIVAGADPDFSKPGKPSPRALALKRKYKQFLDLFPKAR
jgi:ankyrin repeat protein